MCSCLQASPRPRSSSSSAAPVAAQQQQQSARASFSSPAATQGLSLPCFLPVPESQPVLPALLRRLLQQGALREALALAARHEGGPHFRRSLEWLLFTTLDMEAPKCKANRGAGGLQHAAVLGDANVAGAVPAGAYAGVLVRQGKVSEQISVVNASCWLMVVQSPNSHGWSNVQDCHCT